MLLSSLLRPRLPGAERPASASHAQPSPPAPAAAAAGRHASSRVPPATSPAQPRNFVVPPLPPPESLEGSSFFKLHKLRALRRKAKVAGVAIRTDNMAAVAPSPVSASASAPLSPSSSKRSRSRDSIQSAGSLLSPSATTPLATPLLSTQSLLVPSSGPGTPVTADAASLDPTPYPAFLRPDRSDLYDKWAQVEWGQLDRGREASQAAPSDQPHPFARCNGEEYAPRNRYANVDPYQMNRVRLEVPEGHSDYINASPIRLEMTKSHAPLTYIATQGPKADSWSHLWRMVWRENKSPAVVVMLTQTHEQGREKCFPYFPDSTEEPDLHINEHDEFGDGFIHTLHLANSTHDDDARTQVREIDMSTDDGSDSRKIWHLLFAGWPDFSVPEGADRVALLNLIEISREHNSDNATNPRIVHCSAGIGRSGTFIALDWLLQELADGSLDEVPDDHDAIIQVIETLRDQRPSMVQSRAQFLFIYDVLRERWRERWIAQNPAEAAKLGLTSANSTPEGEPALKRQKSVQDGDVSSAAAAEARAQLEAELMGANLQYEQGKT